MQVASSPYLEQGLVYLGHAITIFSLFIWLIKQGSWSDKKRQWVTTLVGLSGVAVSVIANEWQKQSAEAKEASMRLAEQLHHEQLESAAQKAEIAELKAANAEKKAADTETHLEDMRRFSEVAKFTMKGDISSRDSGVGLGTRLSTRMERVIKVEKNVTRFYTTPIHDQYYLEIIEDYPDFPFAYCGLAEAYRSRNDPRWKEYARKAQHILLKTTTFAHCNSHHHLALDYLTKLLKADEPTVTSAK